MGIRNLSLLAFTACLATISPGFADDSYQKKYDKNHDGHWDYKEFRRAQNEEWKKHQDRSPLTDEEMRAEFGRRAYNPRGFVHESGVKDFHNW